MEKVKSFEMVLMRDAKLFIFTNKGFASLPDSLTLIFSGTKHKFTQKVSLGDVNSYDFFLHFYKT